MEKALLPSLSLPVTAFRDLLHVFLRGQSFTDELLRVYFDNSNGKKDYISLLLIDGMHMIAVNYKLCLYTLLCNYTLLNINYIFYLLMVILLSMKLLQLVISYLLISFFRHFAPQHDFLFIFCVFVLYSVLIFLLVTDKF
jgi:hypothetical protein